MKTSDKNTCNGYELSNCCGAIIVCSDICSECKEHCGNACEDCDEIDCENRATEI